MLTGIQFVAGTPELELAFCHLLRLQPVYFEKKLDKNCLSKVIEKEDCYCLDDKENYVSKSQAPPTPPPLLYPGEHLPSVCAHDAMW